MLHRWILRLGVINTIILGAATLISYGAAPVHPFRPAPEGQTSYFSHLGDQVANVSPSVGTYVRGDSPLANRWVFLLAYASPKVLSACVFIILLGLLYREHEAIEGRSIRLLFRWSLVFGAVAIVAMPVLVRDFWLSIGWGRMVAEGANPYYQDMLPSAIGDLPLGAWRERATYGPLWTLVSGILMRVTGSSVLAAFLAFKVLLYACWALALFLVLKLLEDRSWWQQALGIAIFGWLPTSGQQSIAEGHNDIFMVALLLLWLYLLEQDKPLLGTAALTGSFLAKYVTAPLFLMDILYRRTTDRDVSIGRGIVRYWPRLVVASLLTIIVFLPFFHSADLFSSTARMRYWYLLSPRAAAMGLQRITGLPFAPLARLVPLIFIGISVVAVVKYYRKPTSNGFRFVCLAIMSGVLFGLVGHVWPWFTVWVLAFIALVPWAPLSRWTLGVCVLGPLPVLLYSVVYLGSDLRWRFGVPALAVYIFATAWLILLPRRWFEARPILAPPDDSVVPERIAL